MKYLIQVTQEDIDLGCRKNGAQCPIARSIIRTIRAIGEDFSTNISVERRCALIWSRTSQKFVMSQKFPEFATKFVEQFDAGEKVLPFSFELEMILD